MDRRPFGNRGQYAAVPSTPRILGNESPRIQPLPRFRFAEWQRRGMLPPGLNPTTLAKGYRWAHGGRSPYRDPERRACRAYNELELRLALEALALSSEQLLAGIWAAVLQRLMLLHNVIAPAVVLRFCQVAYLDIQRCYSTCIL